MSKTTREILFEAADIIRTSGLHKGWFHSTFTGASCTLGAISFAERGRYMGASDHITDIVCLALDDLGIVTDSISTWNDAPRRTAEEVAAVLEFAASVHA